MCIGGTAPTVDKSAQDFSISQAARARAEEMARQMRIDAGLEQIMAIFEGGVANEISDTKVKNLNNKPVKNGPKTKNNRWADDRWKVLGGDVTGTKTYEGMDPLLTQRETAMRSFYMPQLQDQFSKAKDDMTFALSRAGLTQSTAAGQKQADLTKQYGLAEGDILSRIASDLAQFRSNINSQRSAIEAGLRASGDMSAAANQALQSAVTFRQDQPDLSPLGYLFAGLTEGIGAAYNGYQNERISQLATPRPLSSTGAARVVGG